MWMADESSRDSFKVVSRGLAKVEQRSFFFLDSKADDVGKFYVLIKYLKKESLKRLSICDFQFVVIISTLFI